jgi:hypothetical protein
MFDGAATADVLVLLCMAGLLVLGGYLYLKMGKEFIAIVGGFLVAAAVPPFLLSVVSPLGGSYDIESVLMSSLALIPFSAAFTVLFGLPAFLVLRPFRPGHWWSVTAVGLVLGAAVFRIIQGSLWLSNPTGLFLFATAGALSAIVFWLIWRQAAPQPTSSIRPSP